MDSKSLFLTANADTVYFWVNLDVTKGPIVVETPPLALGVIDDMWFQWVTDFGLPGPDRARGRKYLFRAARLRRRIAGKRLLRAEDAHGPVPPCSGGPISKKNDPKPVVALIKKTLRLIYLPGGYGTSIGSALEGKATLARTPEHKLDWAFLRPEEPAKSIEGTGKVMNTIPPNDFSYFEVINDLVQREPAGALDPEIMGSLAGSRHREGQALQSRCANEKDPDRRGGHRNGRGPNRQLASSPIRGIQPLTRLRVDEHALGWRLQLQTPPPEVSATGSITPNPPTGARTLNWRTAFFFYATFITPAMMMRLTGILARSTLARSWTSTANTSTAARPTR